MVRGAATVRITRAMETRKPVKSTLYDLTIIGGGINGAGIARDAAGRGLSVLLVEAGDLAGATSSASSKLVHGGLRYLEQMEFRLVRAALKEREVLLAMAPHMVRPLRFVLPHVPAMRPRALIRLGLFLYDHLARRQTIPGSGAVDLASGALGAPLLDKHRHGFTYWDCWVDDARLVVLNAHAAAADGADIRTRTRFLGARPADGHWHLSLRDEATGETHDAAARALVNAAGPWVGQVDEDLAGVSGTQADGAVRLVKGSHIVVPRIAGADEAYILQNHDGRVVFVLPFEEHFSLIGTTDVFFHGDARDVDIDDDEIAYLLDAVGRFLKAPPVADDVVWSYAGVRPLFDDAAQSASSVTRDYKLRLDAATDRPPTLTVLGGKLTTYRRLAEEAMQRLAPFFPTMGGPWTASSTLPGGDLPAAGFGAFLDDLERRHDRFDRHLLANLARRHGSLVSNVIGDAESPQDLGRHVGAGLYEREVVHMVDHEWAREPDDVLWRRSKTGVHLAPAERHRAAEAVASML